MKEGRKPEYPEKASDNELCCIVIGQRLCVQVSLHQSARWQNQGLFQCLAPLPLHRCAPLARVRWTCLVSLLVLIQVCVCHLCVYLCLFVWECVHHVDVCEYIMWVCMCVCVSLVCVCMCVCLCVWCLCVCIMWVCMCMYHVGVCVSVSFCVCVCLCLCEVCIIWGLWVSVCLMCVCECVYHVCVCVCVCICVCMYHMICSCMCCLAFMCVYVCITKWVA